MHPKYHARLYALLAATALLLSTSHVSAAPRKIISLREFEIKAQYGEQQSIASILEQNTIIDEYHRDKRDVTLDLAIKYNCPDIACALVLEKPHLAHATGQQNLMGRNILVVAAEKGYLKLLELLIAHGADIHAQEETVKFVANEGFKKYQGQDALTIAARSNNLISHAIVRALILAGADHRNYETPELMYLSNKKRKTIDDALQERASAIRTTLANAAAKKNRLNKQEIENLNTILLHAVIRGDHETVTQILKLDVANVDTKDIYGNTLLIIAMVLRHFDIAKLLITHKANVNAKLLDIGINSAHDGYDSTPLMIAADLESPAMVSLLLEYGADINAENSQHRTALYYAAANGNRLESAASLKIMTLLLDKKRRPQASLELNRYQSESPLTVAVENKNVESIKLLVKAGADTSIIRSKKRRNRHMPNPSICNLIARLKKERSLAAGFRSKMAKMKRKRPRRPLFLLP